MEANYLYCPRCHSENVGSTVNTSHRAWDYRCHNCFARWENLRDHVGKPLEWTVYAVISVSRDIDADFEGQQLLQRRMTTAIRNLLDRGVELTPFPMPVQEADE